MRMHTHVRTGTPKTYAAPAEAKYADDGVKVVKISLEPGRGGVGSDLTSWFAEFESCLDSLRALHGRRGRSESA